MGVFAGQLHTCLREQAVVVFDYWFLTYKWLLDPSDRRLPSIGLLKFVEVLLRAAGYPFFEVPVVLLVELYFTKCELVVGRTWPASRNYFAVLEIPHVFEVDGRYACLWKFYIFLGDVDHALLASFFWDGRKYILACDAPIHSFLCWALRSRQDLCKLYHSVLFAMFVESVLF